MLDHVGAEAASLWKRLRTGADRATVIGFAIPLVAVAAATHAILVEGRDIVTSPPCQVCDSTRYMSMAMYPFANTYHSRNPPFMWRIALPTLAHVLAGSAQTDAVQEWFWRITVCAVAVTAVLLQVFFRKLGMSQPSAVAASTLYVLFGFGGMGLLHGFITPDAVAEACIAGVLVCALYRRGRLLFAILLLGAFVKESIVLGAVFAILWALQRRDWRLLKWAGAGAIGMVVVFLALRIALTPFRWQSPYSLQGEFQHVLYIMTPALAWERLVRSTVGTWGLVLPLAVLQLSHAPRIWRNWAFPAFLLVTYGQLLITRTDIERLIVFAFPVVVAAAAFEFEYLAKRLRVSPLWLWVPVFLTVPITWTWPDWVRVMFFWWASALGHLNVGIYTRMLYQPVNYVAGVLALAALGGSAAAWVAERLIVRRSIMEQGQAPREQQIENALL